MSKSAIGVEHSGHAATAGKRARRPRARSSETNGSSQMSTVPANSGAFPTKPLLFGMGIGAALALTAVALGSRPTRPAYFGLQRPTVARALTKTAFIYLARVVARKALAAAADQGARRLARAWPL